MKITHPWLQKLMGWSAVHAAKAWMSTLDYKVVYHDATLDPTYPGKDERHIYVFWHEYIPFPLCLRGDSKVAMLVSRHRDAQPLAHAGQYLGLRAVQGSSGRGGVAALREMIDECAGSHLCITPDGPRGPRRQLAVGPIYLAAKMQRSIVCMGFGYDRPWRTRSWDRFAIPKPFSRARCVLSPAVTIPADTDREGIEHYRARVEALLEQVTTQAEDWAASREAYRDEYPILPYRMAPRAIRAEEARAAAALRVMREPAGHWSKAA